ncbi:CooT family nickel-binding protein [Methanolobus zinderi]|uniref:CooT family nickel-binding protein n=1 Tax=Methanolobus zinderi TaxID=536044 RepID=A0A7D5E898_9EURY|nr:CooT family nickel-binding protein [Methanolobus zinderi]QLC50219.1 CooT family nickel-binding protein [Methanolobus zinderi]
MCELNAILVKGDERKTVMESVTKMVVEGDSILLYGMLGEKETVEGSIKEVDFSKGETIILGK